MIRTDKVCESRKARFRRRDFLSAATAATILTCSRNTRAGHSPKFEVGEGRAAIDPPLGIELGGFHRPPGQERRVRGIRQSPHVRALAMRHGATRYVIVSADIATVGQAMAKRVQQQVEQVTGIPASHVRVCATHTHSMPAFCYLRQWGALPKEFMATVESKIVSAVQAAVTDLTPAELEVGSSSVTGGNFNRTTPDFKTEAAFDETANDEQRWLDTLLQTLVFRRAGRQPDLIWYHFSAHPVCFADEQAGPDWPGMVAERMRQNHNLAPSFLQGHAGDVNPGDGSPWRGDADETTAAVYAGLERALGQTRKVDVDRLVRVEENCAFPLDIQLFRQWLSAYKEKPANCSSGPWVDAGFAKAWYEDNVRRDLAQDHLTRTIAGLRLGSVALLFHPAELYSFYGLAIRHRSRWDTTLAIGYTDGIVGYLADPRAYRDGEYAATTVPKILDYPPFTPTAARAMTDQAGQLLNRLAEV
jgi:neutral ceramidase